MYTGTIGLFFTAFLVFAKTMPVIAIAEIKAILKVSGEAQKIEGAHLTYTPHTQTSLSGVVHHQDNHSSNG